MSWKDTASQITLVAARPCVLLFQTGNIVKYSELVTPES